MIIESRDETDPNTLKNAFGKNKYFVITLKILIMTKS